MTCLPDFNCLSSEKGKSYRGTRNFTKSGLKCQRWDQQTPHKHDYEGSEENYCRNPKDAKTIWCYTTNEDERFEYCDVQSCSDCEISKQQLSSNFLKRPKFKEAINKKVFILAICPKVLDTLSLFGTQIFGIHLKF